MFAAFLALAGGCTNTDPHTDSVHDPDTDTDTTLDTDEDTRLDTDVDTDSDSEPEMFTAVHRLSVNFEAAYDPEQDHLRSYLQGIEVEPSLRVNLWTEDNARCAFTFVRPHDKPIPFETLKLRPYRGELWIDENDDGLMDEGELSTWQTEVWLLMLDEGWVFSKAQCDFNLDPAVWGEVPHEHLRSLGLGVGVGGELAPVLKETWDDPGRFRGSCLYLGSWEPTCQGPVLSQMFEVDERFNWVFDEWGQPVHLPGAQLWEPGRERPARGLIQVSAGQRLIPGTLTPDWGTGR